MINLAVQVKRQRIKNQNKTILTLNLRLMRDLRISIEEEVLRKFYIKMLKREEKN